MDHSYIEEHNIADRYLLNKLSAEERLCFEEHLENCVQCLDRLEEIDDLRVGLRVIAAEELWRSRAPVEIGLMARILRLSRANRALLLAGAVLLLLLPIGLLIQKWSRGSRELDRASQLAAARHRKDEERERADRDTLTNEQIRDRQSPVRIDQLAAGPESERKDRPPPAGGGKKATPHQSVLPVFALSVTRGDNLDLTQPVNHVILSPSSKLIILRLELGADPDLQSYRAALFTTDGRSIWRASRLKPSSNDSLALSLDSRLFKPADYLLTMEGLTAQKRYVLVARYTFRVATK